MKLLFDTSSTTTEYKWARQLSEAISHKKGYLYKDSLDSWAKEFSKLKRRHSEGDIQRALDYFCAQIDSKRSKKQAVSAFHFRKHFDLILQKAKTSIEQEDLHQITSQLSSFQQKALQRLLSLPWPKGSFVQLPKIYANSIVNYKNILCIIKHLTETTPKEFKKGDVITTNLNWLRFHCLYKSLPSINHFVPGYLEQEVLPVLQNWSGWNGDLSAFEIDLDKPFFRKIFLEMIQQKLELRDYSEYLVVLNSIIEANKQKDLQWQQKTNE